MTFDELIKKLKKDGYEVFENPDHKGLYQINDIANLVGVTFSQSPVDYRISFWQAEEDIDGMDKMVNVQTAVKTVDALYTIIINLTW